ncbi:MAG: DUF202 domain-containing protein [Candidatus Aenigmarchaeota archaeon]|nr:DUF202 domain-containing protein [Candidatus Aenigmarchaeota archaeon]
MASRPASRRKPPKPYDKMSRDEIQREMFYLSQEQTILSKERTVLSFLRTGVTFIGLGIVIVIELFTSPNANLQLIGWAFIILGLIEVLDSFRRLRAYKKKMEGVKASLGDHRV